MNSTNSTNYTNISNQTSGSTTWEESGAMVYIAITVATISAVIMCCTWFIRQKWLKRGYNSISTGKSQVELNEMSDDEEVPLVDDSPHVDNSAFTLEGSESGSDAGSDGAASDGAASDSAMADAAEIFSDVESRQSSAEEIAV